MFAEPSLLSGLQLTLSLASESVDLQIGSYPDVPASGLPGGISLGIASSLTGTS